MKVEKIFTPWFFLDPHRMRSGEIGVCLLSVGEVYIPQVSEIRKKYNNIITGNAILSL